MRFHMYDNTCDYYYYNRPWTDPGWIYATLIGIASGEAENNDIMKLLYTFGINGAQIMKKFGFLI